MTKEYLISWRRFILIAVCLIIMFISIMILFYLKADEITRDPCSICAEKMGDKVTCTTGNFNPISKYYYPNGSIEIRGLENE